MTALRTAAQQALEALKSCSGVPHWPALQPTIGALRAALAQQDEPCPNCSLLEAQNTELDRKLAELDQDEPVQEPVATLIAQRDALLEALKNIERSTYDAGTAALARAAIAKTEGNT